MARNQIAEGFILCNLLYRFQLVFIIEKLLLDDQVQPTGQLLQPGLRQIGLFRVASLGILKGDLDGLEDLVHDEVGITDLALNSAENFANTHQLSN